MPANTGKAKREIEMDNVMRNVRFTINSMGTYVTLFSESGRKVFEGRVHTQGQWRGFEFWRDEQGENVGIDVSGVEVEWDSPIDFEVAAEKIKTAFAGSKYAAELGWKA